MSQASEISVKKRRKTPRVKNPESRLNYLTSLAVDEAEERIKNGTATSQLLVTLINLGTQKAKMELEKAKMDLEVANAKIEQMRSQQSSSEMYEEALAAFRSYKGEVSEDIFDEEY